MAAPANLSFETAGAGAGEAASWTLVVHATAEALADYGPATPRLAYEGFEAGWSSNEGNVGALSDGLLTKALYDTTAIPAGHTVEDFEDYWQLNEAWSATPTLTFADYDGAGRLVETFEDGWSNTVVFATSFADYGGGGPPQLYEDFEQNWNNVTALFFSFAVYTYDVGTHSYESFDGDTTWPALP